MTRKYKYMPEDFKFPLNESLRIFYESLETYMEMKNKSNKIALKFKMDNTHYRIKHAKLHGEITSNEAQEIETYLEGLCAQREN